MAEKDGVVHKPDIGAPTSDEMAIRHDGLMADPRFRKQDLGDLIVDLISSCIEPVRAMIDACDHYFGEGTGEALFYLDILPNAVIKSAVQPE
jgi:hypothetical protein